MSEHQIAVNRLSLGQKRRLLAKLLQGSSPEGTSIELSFWQEGLWFLSRLATTVPLYNFARQLHFRGDLNVHALECALNDLRRRHDLLRTCFPSNDGHPYQVTIDFAPLLLRVADLRPLTKTLRESEIERIQHDEARYIFDLAREPAWRTLLLRTAHH